MNSIPSGILLHNFTIPAPGVPKTVIYHFSDVHLTTHDSLSDDAERAKSMEASASWASGRLWFAEKYSEPMECVQQLPAETHLTQLLSLAEDGDATVLAGDIFDYVSPANLRTLEAALRSHPTPALWVCGNHEDPTQIPDGLLCSTAKQPIQILDLDGVTLVGIDNSRRCITPEQTARVKDLLEGDKPLILVMHIPIMVPGNREILEPCGEYFRLNHSEADEETLAFIELVKSHPGKILAVLSGHLHFRCNCDLVPGIPQYVSSQGILGNINRYEIGI